MGVFRQMDLVFGCLDNREARLAVNRACWRVGVPWVDGALNVADGSVRVFIPSDSGACYECLMTKQDYALAEDPLRVPARDDDGRCSHHHADVGVDHRRDAGAGSGQDCCTATRWMAGRVFITAPRRCARPTSRYPRRADCPAHQTFEPVMQRANRCRRSDRRAN